MLAPNARSDRDVILSNARGAHGVPMAELILALILACAAGRHTLVRDQRYRGQVAPAAISRGCEMEGQTLCVVGPGDVGGTLARKAWTVGLRPRRLPRPGHLAKSDPG